MKRFEITENFNLFKALLTSPPGSFPVRPVNSVEDSEREMSVRSVESWSCSHEGGKASQILF